jgi:hypothetical protein
MANHNLDILCWNVYGLNAEARHSTVHETLASSSCHIIGLQETKLQLIDANLVLYLGSCRLPKLEFLPARGPSGKRGGVLLMWNTDFLDAQHIQVRSFSISAMMTLK